MIKRTKEIIPPKKLPCMHSLNCSWQINHVCVHGTTYLLPWNKNPEYITLLDIMHQISAGG